MLEVLYCGINDRQDIDTWFYTPLTILVADLQWPTFRRHYDLFRKGDVENISP